MFIFSKNEKKNGYYKISESIKYMLIVTRRKMVQRLILFFYVLDGLDEARNLDSFVCLKKFKIQDKNEFYKSVTDYNR